MKIYTSYFSNAKKLGANDIEIIGIALYPPKWFAGVSIKSLAPSYSIFKYSNTEEEYIARFKAEVLSRLDAKSIYERIKSFSNGKDVALCCFEKPYEFCHRHLVAEWLNSKLGLNVEEFSRGPKIAEKPVAVESLTLF